MSMDDRFKTIEAQLELLERRVKALEEKSKPYAGEVAFTGKTKKAVKSE